MFIIPVAGKRSRVFLIRSSKTRGLRAGFLSARQTTALNEATRPRIVTNARSIRDESVSLQSSAGNRGHLWRRVNLHRVSLPRGFINFHEKFYELYNARRARPIVVSSSSSYSSSSSSISSDTSFNKIHKRRCCTPRASNFDIPSRAREHSTERPSFVSLTKPVSVLRE